MNISEMHIWFRQFVQQMGMQNVRAVLPEQIDLCINTSISDKVNQIIQESVATTSDRIITDNSKLSQVNALSTLYKVIELGFDRSRNDTVVTEGGDIQPDLREYNVGRFECSYFMNEDDNSKIQALYLVDLSINYVRPSDTTAISFGNFPRTTWYPVRIIDDIYLADTLQDFILKPRVRSPIAVLHDNNLEIFVGEAYDTQRGVFKGSLAPYKLRVSYIAKPRKVQYMSDIGGENVDCDLPEYMHVDILKHAADLYFTSIRGSIQSQQQAQQNQGRELARNNVRPENEGYQS